MFRVAKLAFFAISALLLNASLVAIGADPEKPTPAITDVTPTKGQLGDQITVTISNLDFWLKSNATPMPIGEEGLLKYLLYFHNEQG